MLQSLLLRHPALTNPGRRNTVEDTCTTWPPRWWVYPVPFRRFAWGLPIFTMHDIAAQHLSDAIAEGRVQLHYQPQVELAGGTLVALEGLSRWTHEQFGPIPAAEFVAAAEANGAIYHLGSVALDQGCRAAKRWRDAGIAVEIAVNVSPLQIEQQRFFDELERRLDDSALPPSALILEVTEAEQIRDPAVLAARLDIVAAWGVTISIDDYGTGHSTLERAMTLHAGELKLDRSMVARMDVDQVGRAVRTAHENGIRVVAEGVETIAQYDFARETGCDRAQGYYVARPGSREQCDQWISQHPGDWRDTH